MRKQPEPLIIGEEVRKQAGNAWTPGESAPGERGRAWRTLSSFRDRCGRRPDEVKSTGSVRVGPAGVTGSATRWSTPGGVGGSTGGSAEPHPGGLGDIYSRGRTGRRPRQGGVALGEDGVPVTELRHGDLANVRRTDGLLVGLAQGEGRRGNGHGGIEGQGAAGDWFEVLGATRAVRGLGELVGWRSGGGTPAGWTQGRHGSGGDRGGGRQRWATWCYASEARRGDLALRGVGGSGSTGPTRSDGQRRRVPSGPAGNVRVYPSGS